MSIRSVFYAFIFISVLLFASFVIADPAEDLARGSFRTTYNPQTGKIDYYRLYNGSDFCLIDGTNCALGGGANSSISGSGGANQIAFWSGPASIVGNANFSLSGTVLRILTTVNASRLLVGGVDVCLANGTNCIAVANGTNGVDGINGSQGPPGVDGLNGTNGINGTSVVNVTYLANGSMNVTLSNGVSFISPNLTGPQGAQGIQGIQGETGATGGQGPAGQAGTNGTNGTNGVNGTGVANATVLANGSLQIGLTNGTIWILNNITGAKGDTGATGSQGPQGIQGEAGATGATGQAGLNGTNGTSVVNITFFANGSMNITLSNGVYFISPNLTGSKGSQGDPGATGATGDPGQNGTNGTGITSIYLLANGSLQINLTSGINTTSGNLSGPAGPQGIQGIQGVQGEPGQAGTNGSNGTGVRNATVLVNGSLQLGLTNGTIWILDNVTGAKGDQGVQGIQGVQGDAGAAGVAGLNGTGIKNIYLLANGSLQINLTNGTNITTANITGATGPQGATGATGQAGTNGSNASVTSGDLYINITNGVVRANITHFDLRYYLSSNPDSYTALATVVAAIQNATICHTDGTNCPPAGGGNSSWNESYARSIFITNGSSARLITLNATNVNVSGITATERLLVGSQSTGDPSEVYVESTNARMRFNDTDGLTMQFSSQANIFSIQQVGGSSKFAFAFNSTSEKIGILTTAPTSELTVAGDANITGKFIVGDLTTENCDLRVHRNGSLYCGEKWRNISTATTQRESTGTAFANITGLAWHAKANTNYSMYCVIMWTTNVSTSGMRMAVEDWGGSVTSAKTAISLLGGATTRTGFLTSLGTGTPVTVAGISNVGLQYPAYIDSTIVNGATPVTITVMFSGESTGLAANITKGGWCDVKTLDG